MSDSAAHLRQYDVTELVAFVEQPNGSLTVEPHTYACGICGGRWSQLQGSDPQTHQRGCPNAQVGDRLV